MTNIHNFDPVTGAYLSTSEAILDPLERKAMVPANATLDAPPSVADGMIAVRDGGEWVVWPDQRGAEYWLPDGSHHTITEIGDEVPPEALDAPPPPPLEDVKSEATDRILTAIDATVMQAAGNPSAREVASWPGKLAAAHEVVAGKARAQPLVPVQLKHGVDAADAAAIVLLNARLYELANTAAEAMAAAYIATITNAPDLQTVEAAERSFNEARAERLAQLAAIQAAAKAGDLGPLEAAEDEIEAAAA